MALAALRSVAEVLTVLVLPWRAVRRIRSQQAQISVLVLTLDAVLGERDENDGRAAAYAGQQAARGRLRLVK